MMTIVWRFTITLTTHTECTNKEKKGKKKEKRKEKKKEKKRKKTKHEFDSS